MKTVKIKNYISCVGTLSGAIQLASKYKISQTKMTQKISYRGMKMFQMSQENKVKKTLTRKKSMKSLHKFDSKCVRTDLNLNE